MASTPRLLLLPFDPAQGAGDPREIHREPFTLGREVDNALVLDGQGVSRHHARIERCPEGWRLLDLGSSNGTMVNGGRVQTHLLRDGDEVQLGDRRVRFLLAPEASAPPPLPPPLPTAPAAAFATSPPPLPYPGPPMPPAAYRPPSPSSRRPRPLLWAGVGAGAMGLLALGAFLLLRPKTSESQIATIPIQALPAAMPPPPTTAAPTPMPMPVAPRPPEVMADPEALAEALGTRFRNGDLEGILILSHPEMRDGFRKAFQGEPERMARAADLLATRKKVNFESGSLMEFEVRDGERTFPLTFERLGGTWVLRSM